MTRFRPVTLLLLGCGAALALASIWLAAGAGRDLDWLPAPAAAPPARVATTTIAAPRLSEASLRDAWQRPLFSATRSPDIAPATQGVTALEGLELSGVILHGDSQWALLRRQDRRPLKLRLGDTLDNGWTLVRLTAHAATFSRGDHAQEGQSRTLGLPVPRLPLSVSTASGTASKAVSNTASNTSSIPPSPLAP